MEWTILLIILVLILTTLAKLTSPTNARYRRKGTLFTKAERSFLGVLNQAISSEYRIFGKVRVADILTPEKGLNRKQWQVAFNKISAKHFDYVLCRNTDLRVVAAIELDDKSHQSKRAIARGTFLQQACDGADLPLIRFPAQATYQVSGIKEQIDLALHQQPCKPGKYC